MLEQTLKSHLWIHLVNISDGFDGVGDASMLRHLHVLFYLKVMELCTQLFAAAVITWSKTSISLTLGLNPLTSDHVTSDVQSDIQRVRNDNIYTALPHCLKTLTAVEPWKNMTTRVGRIFLQC